IGHHGQERGGSAGTQRGRERSHPSGDELGGVLSAGCACHAADYGASTHAYPYAKERPQTPARMCLTQRAVHLRIWTTADLEQNRRPQPRPPRPARAVSTMRLRRENRGASSRMTCSHSVLRNASRLTSSNRPLRFVAPPLQWSILRAS